MKKTCIFYLHQDKINHNYTRTTNLHSLIMKSQNIIQLQFNIKSSNTSKKINCKIEMIILIIYDNLQIIMNNTFQNIFHLKNQETFLKDLEFT